MDTSKDGSNVEKGIQHAKDTHIENITRKILQGDKKVLTIQEGKEDEQEDYDHDKEESKEVAINLTSLKYQHDQARASVMEKKKLIDKYKHEKTMLQEQDEIAEMENEVHSSKIDELENQIKGTKLQFAFESINKKSYMHIIERMKRELLQIKISTNKLEDGIKKRIALLENEKLEYNKVKVEKYRAQNGLEEIVKNVEEDQKKTQAKVDQLTKQINEKTEAVARRIQRLQHRKYIQEAARSDQTDQSEKKLRDQVLVHKFWNSFLRRKMEKEIADNKELSDAFTQIRTATGLEDFQEIVKKFLSRENTYSQLLDSVGEGEKHKEIVGRENDKLTDDLRIKKIELDGLMGGSISLKELEEKEKEEQNLLGKYQRCCIVHDQLRSWMLKIYKVMLSVLEKSDKHVEELKRLRTLDLGNSEVTFTEMCSIIEKLIDDYGQGEGDNITVKALAIRDEFFADESYVQKNMRVRPMSKPTLRRDESFRSSQGPPSHIATQNTAAIEMENVQREINSEFRDDRKNKRGEIKKITTEMRVKKREERKAAPKPTSDPFGFAQLELAKTTPAGKY